MNIRKEKPALILLLVLLISFSCNNSTQTKETKDASTENKEASIEVEVFDVTKIKDQIVETIQQTAETKQVVDMFNNAGASYIDDLTLPVENIDKYMTTTQQSLGLGMYSVDLYYAHVFNRSDIVVQKASLEQQLIDKLGLTEQFSLSKNFSQRISANSGNKDSLDKLVIESMNYYHQQFLTGDHPGIYGISFIGSNIEALYILSQLAQLSDDNAQLITILSGQDDRIKSLFTMMELLSGDESVKPIYEEMIPLVKFYEEHPDIGAGELETIVSLIKKIRDKII